MRSLKALFAAVFISVAIIFIGNYNVLAGEGPTLKDFYEINDYEDLYDGGFHNIEIKPIEIDPAALTFDESSGGSVDAGSGYEYPVEPVVYYRINETDEYATDIQAFKDVGEYTVYYKLTAENYVDYIGSGKVNIIARPFSITVSNQTIKYGETIDSSKYTVAASEAMPAPDAGDDILRHIIAEGETLSVTLSVQDGATIVPEIKIVDSSNKETTGNYDITCTPGTLTYELVSPTLSGISATAITYGKTLADSTITGTAKYGDDTVAGTFAFDAPDTAPAVADPAAEYAFTFTPDESVAKYFNSVSGNVSVTVTPVSIEGATVVLSANQLTYSGSEQTVSVTLVKLGDAVLLTDDYEVSGNTGAVPGSYTVTVTGKGNYSGSATSAFSIDPATPTLSDIEATSITWGQALGESTISGTAKFGNEEVSGTWSFDNPDTIPANAGTENYDVTFTPNEDVAELYTTASGEVSVTVEPVSIEGAEVLLKAYKFDFTGSEQTVTVMSVKLGSVELPTDDYEVSGNTGTDVGEYTLTVKGKGNYTGSATTTFMIAPATPKLSDISATAITLGDALSQSTISGVAKVNNTVISGTWSFDKPDTIPENAGTQDYDVIFTPDDATNCTSALGKVSVNVKPINRISIKGAVVTLNTNALTYTGSKQTVSVKSVKLGDVVLSPEYYSVSGNTGTDPGTYIVTVKGKGNYSGTATATFRILQAKPVDPVTPILSDIVAEDITWGEPLTNSKVKGVALADGVEVPGTWSFNNPEFVPENAGTSTYDVTFTPDNRVADLYTSALGEVSVTVNPISLKEAVVTLNTNILTYTGSAQTVSVMSVTLDDFEFLTDCYEVSGNTGTDVGEYTVTVTGKGNFSESATATFLITPATPKLSDISATAITLGDALSKSTISGVAKFDSKDISGTWSFDAPDTIPENAGTSSYAVTFTPDDSIADSYTSVSSSVSVTVNPLSISGATVTLSKNELTYTGSEQTVSVTSVKLGDDVLSPDCYDVSNNTGTAVGSYTVTIIGKGNYAGTATATFEIINPAPEPGSESHGPITPVLSDISATSITWGDALNKSTITGVAEADGVEVSGTWSFTNPDTKPENIGTYSYEARFTPSDTTNYSSVTTSVSVTVNGGIRTVPGSLSAEFVYSTSVSLTSFTDCEYSMNGTDWQDSNIFEGLTPNTEYTFYARYKESLNYTIADESAYTSITVKTKPHVHEWTFDASGNTITAKCANSDGGHEGKLTQKIVIKASNRNYKGKAMTATVIGSIDGIAEPTITYKEGNTVLRNAPKNAGTYTANISIFDDVNNQTITASKEFKIKKAKYIITSTKITKSFKANSLKSKAKTINIAKSTTVKTVKKTNVNSNKITYKVNSSNFSINNKGKLTIHKGIKKGKYNITISVTVKGDNNHQETKKSFKIQVTIK